MGTVPPLRLGCFGFWGGLTDDVPFGAARQALSDCVLVVNQVARHSEPLDGFLSNQLDRV